jgi:putative ABC transport system permease protein
MSDLPAGAECAASVLVYKTQNHGQVCDDADAYGQEHDYDGNATDYQQQRATIRAMITILNIFAYGFVILISLIAMTNVFNTISTNIGLRRREFAMLKSVGMTAGGFNKMMNYECLLYGVKGLMYGLPVSFGVTWLIYRSVSEGIIQRFYVPWNSVIIAVLSVFIVVFATMLYAMHKIKRENPMDVLKNDNF